MTGHATKSRPYLDAALAAIGVLTLTSAHHVYGAIIYQTPWRLDILRIAIPAAIVIAAGFTFAHHRRSRAGRAVLWITVAIVVLVPVLMIGFLEGGYNHVVKNLAYLTGGEGAVQMLFGPPLYAEGQVELPNDLLFELSGIAQFPLAVLALWTVLRLRRPQRFLPAVAREGAGRNVTRW